MLRELSIQNFKSIGHEITFSMEADVERVHEFPEHILPINGVSLLRVASMYGPNGGGKSNIIDAIVTLNYIVNQSEVNGRWNLCCAYSDSDTITEEAYFVTDKYEIGYKIDFKTMLGEKPNNNINGETKMKSYTYFDIIGEEVAFRRKGEDSFNNLLLRKSDGKVISQFLESFHIPTNLILGNRLSAVAYFRSTFFNDNAKNLSEPLIVLNDLFNEILCIKPLTSSPNINVVKAILNTKKEKLISYLCSVDICVSDIEVDQKNDIYFVRTITKDNNATKKSLAFNLESSGTQQIFGIFINVLNGEDHKNIYFADDLNAYLHPKLLKFIIESFNSPNNTNSQLIFNSHDILNMTNDIFRRDEIWFTYRNENYQSELVSLANIVNYKGKQIRKDASYFKQYLEGKYGADPFIKSGLLWDVEK